MVPLMPLLTLLLASLLVLLIICTRMGARPQECVDASAGALVVVLLLLVAWCL